MKFIVFTITTTSILALIIFTFFGNYASNAGNSAMEEEGRTQLRQIFAKGNEPNPPTFPSNVGIFGPEDDTTNIQAFADAAIATNGGNCNLGQFSDNHYALMFKPGTYSADVSVGYYMQVLGLGESPDDVIFNGEKGVFGEEGCYDFSSGALDTFWRSIENFKVESNHVWFGDTAGMLWAVSQASPMRRIHATNDLSLFQYTYGDAAGSASGGYMADCTVDGSVLSGSQQQWFTRNSKVGSWVGGVWNMVFAGVDGAPESLCDSDDQYSSSFVVVDEVPVISEKPFISITSEGSYKLNVPPLKTNSVGPSSSAASEKNAATPAQIDFSQVYVATDKDSAAVINAKLSVGLHVVLSPGIYHLEEALELMTENQILLGLGIPILKSTSGNAVVKVGNVDGVRVAGVLLEAGVKHSKTLLQWGDGTYSGNSINPGFLHDVFARVGGPDVEDVSSEFMVRVESGHVIGDDLWLWRADHNVDGLVKSGANACDTAIHISGDDVTMHGLAVEHTLKNMMEWFGERGELYFFQSEYPYDVTQENYGDQGYVAYKVGEDVKEHLSYGAGVYHFFRDEAVKVFTGISAPEPLEINFIQPLVVYLNGLGQVEHVINDKGQTTHGDGGLHTAWICGDPADAPTGEPAPPKCPCEINCDPHPSSGRGWCSADGGCNYDWTTAPSDDWCEYRGGGDGPAPTGEPTPAPKCACETFCNPNPDSGRGWCSTDGGCNYDWTTAPSDDWCEYRGAEEPTPALKCACEMFCNQNPDSGRGWCSTDGGCNYDWTSAPSDDWCEYRGGGDVPTPTTGETTPASKCACETFCNPTVVSDTAWCSSDGGCNYDWTSAPSDDWCQYRGGGDGVMSSPVTYLRYFDKRN